MRGLILWGVRNVLTPVLVAALVASVLVTLGVLFLYFTGWEIPTG